MVHQALVIISYGYMVVVGVGLFLYLLLCLSEPVEKQWKLRQERRIDYARYAALRDVRAVRRHAIREMLKAERERRDTAGYGEIIDGTCHEVEVRR